MTREDASKLPAPDPLYIYDKAMEWIAKHSDGQDTDSIDGQHSFAYFATQYLDVPENRADDFGQVLKTYRRDLECGIG